MLTWLKPMRGHFYKPDEENIIGSSLWPGTIHDTFPSLMVYWMCYSEIHVEVGTQGEVA